MEVTPYFRLLLLPVVAAVAATQVRFITAKPVVLAVEETILD